MGEQEEGSVWLTNVFLIVGIHCWRYGEIGGVLGSAGGRHCALGSPWRSQQVKAIHARLRNKPQDLGGGAPWGLMGKDICTCWLWSSTSSSFIFFPGFFWTGLCYVARMV